MVAGPSACRHRPCGRSTCPIARGHTDRLRLRRRATGLPARYRPVGFNDRAAAGQTVFHAHLHVIPRYGGDVPDPAGGIRHTVPGRGRYPLDR
ncbi:HIT family protein [Curtobacterium flaccumfaciens]|uniref:HIT family protein n=1 Tax=Curtobacterium flaccumfaciens TaxID=2035 RepID=UPI003995E63E